MLVTFVFDIIVSAKLKVFEGLSGVTGSCRVRYEFVGELGGMYECKFDIGVWVVCMSL